MEAPFQVGCDGLHGCTVMTLASDKAVYMAHYWEIYALNGDDDLTPGSTGQTKFQERVLSSISGSGTQDSQTTGSGITWKHYGKGTSARLFITTSAVDGWDGKNKGLANWKYRNKVEAMIALIQEDTPGVAVQVTPYKRLNYSNNGGNPTGPDAAIVGKNARGMAFFQWDGTMDNKYWRLFYEYDVYQRGDKI